MAHNTIVAKSVDSWKERLSELQDVAQEIREIEQALEAVGATTAKRGRPAGKGRSGSRRNEFLKVIKENPGITVNAAAEKLGIQPNYLYRLAGDLSKEGTVEKKDKGYVLVAQDAENASE